MDVLLPPGISNSSSNCYANAVLQVLLHHTTFLKISTEDCKCREAGICPATITIT